MSDFYSGTVHAMNSSLHLRCNLKPAKLTFLNIRSIGFSRRVTSDFLVEKEVMAVLA